MRTTEQLELDRPARAQRAGWSATAGPKSILLHVQSDNSVDERLETALSLARAYSAHVECLHVTPIEAYVAFDSFGGVFVMNDVIRALDEEEAKLRERIEAKLAREDVSWDYRQVTGNVAAQIISHAALADLVVSGRDPHDSDFKGPALGLLGDLVDRLRTPLFIPADNSATCDPTGTALIAWDGGYEAANAVRASLGMLKLAGKVEIVQVREAKDESFPGTRLLEFLSRHGIHAELNLVDAGDSKPDQDFVAGALFGRAKATDAAYVVMGGYNHSRLGQYIFGGVTRTMLARSPVPVVIAR